MTFDWQTAIALIIVAAAIAYLCSRFVGSKAGGCGGCGSDCSVESNGIKKRELVQLGETDQTD